MTDTLDTAVDPETTKVETALEAFVAANDASALSPVEYRGARYDAGLAWVHFPEGFGGLGVRPKLQAVVERRLREAGAPPPADTLFFGLALAGPTVVTHGSDEVRHRLLRPMFTGEEVWCQLFSEPGAGSDLAGLATRAVRTVTSGWSTARRSGTRSPTSPTAGCSSPAPTRTSPSTRA